MAWCKVVEEIQLQIVACRRIQNDFIDISQIFAPNDCVLIILQRFVLYSEDIQVIASPTTKAAILKIKDASNNNPDFLDSAELDVQRVRVSTENFVALAKLAALPPIPDADIKLVSIPQMILSVAMGDTSLPATVVSFSFL
jgi:hypothetical protein